MLLDERTDGVDHFDASGLIGYPTRLRTRWIDAGAPTWKKSWRRPDFLIRGVAIPTVVNVSVFHDFDFNNAERSFEVIFDPGENPSRLWGEFDYGDGTVYGAANQTSTVERGSTMGRAGTVQLLTVGTPGKPWGLNGIILKYVPRRFR